MIGLHIVPLQEAKQAKAVLWKWSYRSGSQQLSARIGDPLLIAAIGRPDGVLSIVSWRMPIDSSTEALTSMGEHARDSGSNPWSSVAP
jgi:hypothetical protein